MSGLFGDLLKPGDGSAHALKSELELRASRDGDRARVARYLLQHGETWRGIPTPDEFKGHIGEPQRCFNNALAAAAADPRLTYVEGLYNVGGRAAEHAWCVDPEGRLVELTFMSDERGDDDFWFTDSATGMRRKTRPELFAYYGVRVAVPVVQRVLMDMRAHFGDERWGILHPENGAPLLDVPTGVQR